MMANIMGKQLQREVELFTEQAKSAESWKAEHNKAMICRDLEDLAAQGLHLIERLRLRHNQWRDQIAAGKLAYSQEVADSVRNTSQQWYEAATKTLALIQKAEKTTGMCVDNRDALAQAIAGSPPAESRMTRAKFAKIVASHPIKPERYEQAEKSLAHFD